MPPKRKASAEKQTTGKSKKAKIEENVSKSEVKATTKTSTKSKAKTTTKASSKVTAKSSTKTVAKSKGKTTTKTSVTDIAVGAMASTEPKGSWMYELLTDPDWRSYLAPCFNTDNFRQMEKWVQDEYKKNEVFPPKQLIFNAFNLTPFSDIKIVILGQDPYHDNGQAHGLSFSVPRGIGIPPSLKNIYKELVSDVPAFVSPAHGCLMNWTTQGVLLLNAALTVQAHVANSHARCGWWKFTDDVIRVISDQAGPCVFILWGGFAHKKESLIDGRKHRIVKTAHPSPLSFNKFRNCKCFSQANDKLKELGRSPVDWTIDP